MMYCRSCGNQLPDDAVFCNGCGTRVQVDEDDATRKGRPTIQFDSNPQFPPTQFSSGPQPPLQQFGSNPQLPPQQFGSSPQLPSSWQTPTSSQSGQMFPPMTPSQPGLSSGANWPQQEFPLTSPTQPGLPPEPIWPQPGQLILPPVPPQSRQSSGAIWPQSGQMLPPTAPFQSSQPLGATWPQTQQVFPPTTPFQSAQPLGVTWPQTQQVFPPTQASLPYSAMQRVLIRIFQPALASNALLGILLGGILAAVLGVLVSVLLVAIAHAIAPHLVPPLAGEDMINNVLGIVSLRSPFRDGLQLFLVMHGAGLHTQFASSSDSSSFTFTFLGPLNGLLVVPALLLTFGGYIAASTDFQNNVRRSLLRGAAIAIPYTIVLLILVSQVNGCVPLQSGGSPDSPYVCTGSFTGTLSVDILTLLLFGLLWGGLFGLLGASLKLARGQWGVMIRRFLSIVPRPQVAGMITGGLAATGLGIVLSLIVLYSLLAYTAYSIPLFTQKLCNISGDWQIVTTWGIAQGPLHAVNLFFFSFGAPITVNNPSQLGQPCFYANSPHTTFSLLNGHLPPWIYALLALPVISLFIGGRVSAATGRVQGVGPGAVQGALIAVPFTLLMMLLSVICTITSTYSSSATNGASGLSGSATTYVQSAGVGAFDLLLWALLSGAVLGALGGIYQTSTVKTSVSNLLSILTAPLRLLGKPVSLIIDRHRTSQPSQARILLYSAFFCVLLLAIVAGVAGGIFIALNSILSLSDNQRIRDILAVLLIALPGLLLLSACASALSTDPSLASRSYTNTASAPAPRF